MGANAAGPLVLVKQTYVMRETLIVPGVAPPHGYPQNSGKLFLPRGRRSAPLTIAAVRYLGAIAGPSWLKEAMRGAAAQRPASGLAPKLRLTTPGVKA
jgi:hypothetical protein